MRRSGIAPSLPSRAAYPCPSIGRSTVAPSSPRQELEREPAGSSLRSRVRRTHEFSDRVAKSRRRCHWHSQAAGLDAVVFRRCRPLRPDRVGRGSAVRGLPRWSHRRTAWLGGATRHCRCCPSGRWRRSSTVVPSVQRAWDHRIVASSAPPRRPEATRQRPTSTTASTSVMAPWPNLEMVRARPPRSQPPTSRWR